MKITPQRLIRGAALLGLILLMTTLFVLSRTSLAEHEKEVVNSVLRFKRIDAEMNETVLRTHFNLLHNYDPLVAGVAELRQTSSEMRERLSHEMENAPALGPLMDRIDRAIDEKEVLLERYKRANAVRKNSQRYFPVVASELQHLLVSRSKPPTAFMDDLFGLMRETLEQKFRSTDAFLRRVEIWTDKLKAHPVAGDAEEAGRKAVAQHALLMAEGMVSTEERIQALLDFPLAPPLDRLLDEVRHHAERERRVGERYRFLIFLTAILLSLYVGYLLMRLRRTVRSLGEQKFALDQHAAVTAAGTDWRITYANGAMTHLSRFSLGELMGRDLRSIDGGKQSEELFAMVTKTLSKGKVWKGEYQSLDREGRPYWVDAAIVPFLDDQGAPISYMTIRTDISARKFSEQERMRLHMAIEQAADSVIITNAQGDIEYANPAFEAITGYGREEVLGTNPRFLKSGKHDDAFYQKMWDELTAGKVWEGRMINRRKAGDFYEEEVRITPVVDASGAIINYVAVKSDVTRREMLIKAREFFSAIASHELRTPLTKLQLVKMMLDQQGGRDIDGAVAVLDECFADLERLIASTTLLSELQLSLPDKDKRRTPLGPMVGSAVDIARTQADSKGKEVVFDVRLAEVSERYAIMCDPHLILKAIGELLNNAVQYSPDKEVVTVTCRKVGDQLEVVVADRGGGMDQATLEMVREPFFSSANPSHHHTRRVGEGGAGIGLGLTITALIVEAHGGLLTLESEGEGKGVTARLLFPMA